MKYGYNGDAPYFDSLGLPVTDKGDGGDSAAEAGTLLALDPHSDFSVWRYLPITGPVRHPDTDKWYGRPWRFSRDQLVALLCGLAMRRGPEYFNAREDLYYMHRRRKFLTAWNYKRNFVYDTLAEHLEKSSPDVRWDFFDKQPDITGPEVWALWFRAWRKGIAWPLLWLLDLETLVGAVVWRFKSNGLGRNHLLVCFVSTSILPTPISWLARLITPTKRLIDEWGEHCRRTGAIDTSPYFERAFKK